MLLQTVPSPLTADHHVTFFVTCDLQCKYCSYLVNLEKSISIPI